MPCEERSSYVRLLVGVEQWTEELEVEGLNPVHGDVFYKSVAKKFLSPTISIYIH